MFFHPANAASPSLYDHLFWFLGRPETTYLILPGFVWTIIAALGHKRLLSGLGLATAAVGGALVLLQAAGYYLPSIPERYFIPAAMSIPVAGAVVSIAKTRGESTRTRVPALWMYGAVFLYVTGGITSFLFTGTDRALTDIFHLDQHLRHVLTLCIIFVVCAGWYRFFPGITGYSYSTFIAGLHLAATAAGLYILFFIDLFMGTSKRLLDEDLFARINLFSSLGAWISLLAFLIFTSGVAAAVWRRQKAI